jgi:hypothetical protein
MLLATLGAGLTLVVASPHSVVLVRALLGIVALLTLVLVEALWWVRPWVVRTVDAWAAGCVGAVLVSALVGVVAGGVGIAGLVLIGIVGMCLVGMPCWLVRWYVRDRARRLGLAPGAAP